MIDANDALLEMLGYSRAELESGELRLNKLTPHEWRAQTNAALEQLRNVGSVASYETDLVRKDGSYLQTVVGLAGDTETLVGFILDRTEQKLAAQKLRTYAAALETSNRELESFSYSVAHDLRAPLRNIDGFIQALLEDYADKLDEQGRKYLNFARASVDLMRQCIDALLTLSRITQAELRREEVDLSALAREAIVRLRRGEPDRSVDVVISDGLKDSGDPRMLAVVLDNLLGNAWKFTAKRSGAWIEFGVSSTDSHPVYFVRDNGAGFDMAFADKLFGAFQRFHLTSEFEGIGVGLATVQRIVSRHGGRVWAEAEVNGGATFYFTLGEMVAR